jgi:hypothetical protein
MLVQRTLRSRLPSVFSHRGVEISLYFITGEKRLPGVYTARELRLNGVFITRESFLDTGESFY